MYLERLLQINMATLAALGALLLGMGQRSEFPPLLVVMAAVVSAWLTDVTRRFCLGRRTANALMLLAAAVALRDVFPLHGDSELQALDFAWLLIYLQIILLFQRKDERIYWLLVMLSLLQVVVASLFGQGMWFGALLVVYMLLGFSAMTLLMTHRQWERHRPEAGGSGVGDVGSETLKKARWPLSQQRPEFTCLPSGGGHAGIGKHLFRLLGGMGLQTLGLALVLFFAVPRFGQVPWRGAIMHPQPLVGFTDKVTLGELGQIIESREEVMRARFYRKPDDVPRPLKGDVYLKGAFLMTYKRGQWHTGQPSALVGSELLPKPRRLPLSEMVRQAIIIYPLDRNELFYVSPYIPLTETYDIDVDRARKRLCRAYYLRMRRFEYTLGTTAIVDGAQKPLTPSAPDELTFDTGDMPQGEDSLPNLVALAKRWIDESKLPASDPVGRARYLEQKLAASGQFQYSLTGQPRDPDIDPIEDFVSKHRAGHCEYFATALTLMLRSQEIRSRLVSGYKCDQDDWNALGGYYEVRQLHAHTWVEAYLRRSQIPPDLIHGKTYWDNWRSGGWLRLDPTPAGGGKERTDWFTPVRQKLDWLETAWSKYVVELDCQRQRDAIYGPIAAAAKSVWQEATDPRRWRAMFNSVSVALYLDHLNREVRGVLLGLLAIVAAVLLVGAVWLLWRIGRRLTARWTGYLPRRGGGRGGEVDFYRQFERLLARWGLVRAAAQTQGEFAAAAGARLAALTGETRLAAVPGVVADAFYRVRFGRTPLDSSRTQAVEHALQELFEIGKAASKGARP